MHPELIAALAPRHWIGLAVTAAALAWLVVAIAARLASGRSRVPKRAARPPRADGLIEIYVGNANYDMTDAQLRAEFAKYGIVQSARVVTHPSGKSKGYGFVLMPHRAEAEIAIKALDGADVMGRKLRVNEARGASK